MTRRRRAAVIHRLDLRQPFYDDVASELKQHEVRWERADRRFEMGDILVFTDPDGDGKGALARRVRYVTRGLGWYGVPEHLCVLGLETPTAHEMAVAMLAVPKA